MNKLLISLIFILLPASLLARADSLSRHAISVQIGTDIGGVVPFPPSNIPETFRPIPALRPNIGIKYSIRVHRLLGLSAEANYKHVEMSADAIVTNMSAEIPNVGENGESLLQYFSGRATMNMAFDLLEVPVYLTFYIPRAEKNKILIGPYFAWHIKSQFTNNPIDGFIGKTPDTVDAIITPESKIPSEQTNFSQYLSPWDWGISFGYERKIYNRMDISLRFSFGLKDIFETKILSYSMNSMRGTVSLSYKLWKF